MLEKRLEVERKRLKYLEVGKERLEVDREGLEVGRERPNCLKEVGSLQGEDGS